VIIRLKSGDNFSSASKHPWAKIAPGTYKFQESLRVIRFKTLEASYMIPLEAVEYIKEEI